jgi:hypothetical protein
MISITPPVNRYSGISNSQMDSIAGEGEKRDEGQEKEGGGGVYS